MSHYINRNLTVVHANEFQGLPVLVFKNGIYEEYLQNNFKIINQTLAMYAKVFAVRIDLRFPDDDNIDENRSVTRFIESLKAQIKADYIGKCNNSDGFVHQSEVLYIWVQETGIYNKSHYHLCLFFNGNAYRSLGAFELGRPNMYNRIVKAWASALALDVVAAQGLVHFPKRSCYLLERSQLQLNGELSRLFMRLSYFAKVDTKTYGDGHRHYGSSRVMNAVL
ncbi:inovirus Gp2 family protein [Shewanella baltica]|uniref:inovirus Gp2 family protein n=1 Tax=Shewanella baltica TaxID=62322 RepID=UPI003D799695